MGNKPGLTQSTVTNHDNHEMLSHLEVWTTCVPSDIEGGPGIECRVQFAFKEKKDVDQVSYMMLDPFCPEVRSRTDFA